MPDSSSNADATPPSTHIITTARASATHPAQPRVRQVLAPVSPSAPSILDYLHIVWRHRWLVMIVAAAIAGIGWTRIRNDVPQFAAQATIRMVDTKPAIAGGLASTRAETQIGSYIDPLMTQIQVMRSRAVAAATIDTFGLRLRTTTPGFYSGYFTDIHVSPEQAPESLGMRFTEKTVTASNGGQTVTVPYAVPLTIGGVTFTTPGRPASPTTTLVVTSREDAIDDLLNGLQAKPREMTSVIDIMVQASDPYFAQRAANAVAMTLKRVSALDAQRTSRARRVFIEEQLQIADSTLRAREGAVAEYQRGEQSFSVRDNFTRERTQLTGLDQRRRDLQATLNTLTTVLLRLRTHDSTSRQAIRSFAYSADASVGPAITQQAADLVRLDRTRDSLTTGAFAKTAAHPDVQRIDALLASAETRMANAIRSQTATLSGALAAINADRAQSAGSIARLPGAEEREGYLLRERDNIRKMAEKLNDELQLARISEAVEAGQVEIVDLSQIGAGPLGSGRKRKLFFATLLGLLGGGLAALGLDRLNRSIRSEEDLESRVGVPCLVVIRRFDAGGPSHMRLRIERMLGRRVTRDPLGLRELVLVSDSESGAAESYRSLVTNLLFGTGTDTGPLGALAVTSALAAEGKTTTAANLAVAFAQQGRRVVLVDADLRRARLHETFGSSREPGLTAVLTGQETLASALRPQFVAGLTLLPAGRSTPRPLETIASDAMRTVLRELREMFDVVILDTPPVFAAADASTLVGQVDGTLLVVRAGRTNREAARRAAQQIASVGGFVIGAVLNDADQTLESYGYYGHYRYSNQPARA